MDQITQLPLAEIDASALPRDRLTLDPEALAALQRSILADGLRQPIEVFPLVGTLPWGLISGLRRLTVFRTLAEHLPRFATIPAVIRPLKSDAEALAAMVTENEIREPVSPWEKAKLISECSDGHPFPTIDAAIDGLFPASSPVTRSRLRAIVTVVDTLYLTDGPAYSLRQLLRIASAIKAGFGEVMEVALREHHVRGQPAQWDLLQNILMEAELSLRDPVIAGEPERHPKRLSYPHQRGGLTIRREWLPNGWRLVMTGPEAKGMMIESVMAEIERQYGPPPR